MPVGLLACPHHPLCIVSDLVPIPPRVHFSYPKHEVESGLDATKAKDLEEEGVWVRYRGSGNALELATRTMNC